MEIGINSDLNAVFLTIFIIVPIAAEIKGALMLGNDNVSAVRDDRADCEAASLMVWSAMFYARKPAA